MLSIYRRASAECNYIPTRFLRMVNELGGVGAARALLHARELSDGFTHLWQLGRLDLTMEALIVENPEYRELFSAEEIDIARRRLRECRYEPREGT